MAPKSNIEIVSCNLSGSRIHGLAIIIPFYKNEHFESLLQALMNQTNKEFSVYIGDDCSPTPPDALIEKYKNHLDITHVRFSSRLGHVSLTKQWGRCLEVTKDEEWIWFLPDDDLPSPNCVEEFYQAFDKLENNTVKVFRLPLDVIDQDGSLLQDVMASPELESNYQFYSRVVRGKTVSSLGDNIFNRKAFKESGGFVEFPKAWGSDHATVLRVSAGSSICCLKNAKLSFRMSGRNISSDTSDGVVKISARLMFAEWLKANKNIFPVELDVEFFKLFYRKSEYYLVHEWPFDLRIWSKMYQLSIICHGSYSPWPLMNLLLIKIRKTLTQNN